MSKTINDILSSQVVIPFLIGFIVVVAAALTALLIRNSYRKSVRKALQTMVQEKEAIKALIGGVVETKGRLNATSEYVRRTEFVSNPNADERVGLADLRARAAIVVDELDLMPVPKKLIPLAEALADIAFLVEEELARVKDARTGDEALEILNHIDEKRLEKALLAADKRLEELAVLYGISEIAVYKGGFYV